MAIGFVVGRAGTGKTRHCLSEIKRLLRDDPMGPPIFWIVPRQATFSTERLLLTEFGPFSRCRILSFNKLGEEILGATGGVATTQITARGRQMIVGLLLRQNQSKLRYFAPSARRIGLARELDRTFAEFELAGLGMPELVQTLEAAMSADPTDADTESLLAKARDLHLLYAEYTRFVGQDRTDPHGRRQRVLELLGECPMFKGSIAFIDGFTNFTRHEKQMVVGLARVCADVTVTLLADPGSKVITKHHLNPDELSLFHKTERQYRDLMTALAESGATIQPIAKLTTPRRFTTRALAHLEQSAFDRKPIPSGWDGIERIVAPDRAAEVDAVARRIRELTREQYRYRDITVLTRDLTAYLPLITASFREHGIAHFIDVRRSAMHHPLLQWLRSIFAIARAKWPHDDTIALLKSGLAGVPLDAADEIENYVLEHGIVGEAWENPDPWKLMKGSLLVGEGEEAVPQETIEPSEIDGHRQALLGKLRPFLDVIRHQSKLTFRQIATEVFRLIDAFGVRITLGAWADRAREAGDLELAGEHEQTWGSLVELFDEMIDLLGDHEVDLDDFLQTLASGLESFDFALAPATLDQVEVGEIERSRTADAKVTFVLGLGEGLFPMAGTEPSVLTDTDRGLLRRRSIELDDDVSRRLLDERLLGYLAFTRASERLILTRPSAERGGKPLNPSVFWSRVDELFPGIKEADIKAPCFAHDTPDCVSTPRQLVTGLMRWARQHVTAKAAPIDLWPALYNEVAAICPSPGVPGEGVAPPLIKVIQQSWSALAYANDAALSSPLAAALYPSPLQASVSRIETFATCPFKHFAQYGLQLHSRQKRDFSFVEIGQAYHRILEEIVTGLLQSKSDWKDLSPDLAQQKIKDTAAAVAKELHDEVMLSSARNRYLLTRIEKTLTQVVAAQISLAERQTLRPSRTGVGFGGPKDKLRSPLIQTPKHRDVQLHGRIDRVDRVPGKPLFSIIDYKSGDASLNLQNVYHGLALQLLAYMLVLRENGAGQQLTPIGAFYHRVTRSLQREDHPSLVPDPGTDEFHLREKPRGILHAEFVRHFDQNLTEGASLAVNVSINKTGEFGRRDYSDVADAAEIDQLLDFVRSKIATLADDLMDGNVSVYPYRIGDKTPCSHCDYRSVCRFEVGINRYHTLAPMKRAEAIERIAKEAGDA